MSPRSRYIPDGVYADTGDGASTDTAFDGALAGADWIEQGGDQQATEPRTPVALVIITADYCSRTFGVAPCTATGEKCFNTFPTCKDQINYGKTSKSYRFVSGVAPITLDLVRPYVRSVKLLPTEIKTNLTVSGRVSVTMEDEPDTDVGIDPYVTTRSAFPAIPGTFWKKWLARNRNYKGRPIDVYEGFVGQSESAFVKRWTGKLENVTRSGASVKIEAVDLLKDLAKIDVPPKLDLKLSTDLLVDHLGMTIYGMGSAYGADAAFLDSPSGALMIDQEVVTYTSINTATGVIGGLTRGMHGTTAAAHSAKAKVGKVKVYAVQNAIDALKSMLLVDAAMSTDNVDVDAFAYWRDYPGGEPNVSAVITEPTKLSTLFFELLDLVDCKAWVGEDLKITIARTLPNDPVRQFSEITDESGIIYGPAKVDQNEKSRLTRTLIYWDKIASGKDDDPASYGRLDVAIDDTAEGVNDYAEIIEKKVMCRWINSTGNVEEDMSAFARNLVMRQVWRNRDASPIITFDVDLKDEGIKTGAWVHLSTDEFVDQFGQPFSGQEFQVVKRDKKENVVTLSLIKGANGRCLLIAPDTLLGDDWGDATAAEQAYGAICDNNGFMPGSEQQGYRIW